MVLFSDVIKMINDIKGASPTIAAWGRLLNFSQLLGGLVFIRKLEGQVVLATLLVTLVIAGQIHKRAPFSRLVGLCHIPWLLLLPWLVSRLLNEQHSMAFLGWGYLVATLIAISLVFDVADVARYFRGEKTFSWGA